MNTSVKLLLFVIAAVSQTAQSAPVIETTEQFELNWGKLQLRFTGESQIKSEEDSFKDAESRAWQNGLYAVMDEVKKLHVDRSKAIGEEAGADASAQTVSTSTYSYNTTYYSDGLVRVYLENRLSRVFRFSSVKFKHDAPVPTTGIQFTGIILKTDKSTLPLGAYKLIDENGTTLFEVTDMAAESYRRNLMGRWYVNATTSEVKQTAGSNPIEVDVSVQDDGSFSIPNEQWENALSNYKPLLVNGKILINLPK